MVRAHYRIYPLNRPVVANLSLKLELLFNIKPRLAPLVSPSFALSRASKARSSLTCFARRSSFALFALDLAHGPRALTLAQAYIPFAPTHHCLGATQDNHGPDN